MTDLVHATGNSDGGLPLRLTVGFANSVTLAAWSGRCKASSQRFESSMLIVKVAEKSEREASK